MCHQFCGDLAVTLTSGTRRHGRTMKTCLYGKMIFRRSLDLTRLNSAHCSATTKRMSKATAPRAAIRLLSYPVAATRRRIALPTCWIEIWRYRTIQRPITRRFRPADGVIRSSMQTTRGSFAKQWRSLSGCDIRNSLRLTSRTDKCPTSCRSCTTARTLRVRWSLPPRPAVSVFRPLWWNHGMQDINLGSA